MNIEPRTNEELDPFAGLVRYAIPLSLAVWLVIFGVIALVGWVLS